MNHLPKSCKKVAIFSKDGSKQRSTLVLGQPSTPNLLCSTASLVCTGRYKMSPNIEPVALFDPNNRGLYIPGVSNLGPTPHGDRFLGSRALGDLPSSLLACCLGLAPYRWFQRQTDTFHGVILAEPCIRNAGQARENMNGGIGPVDWTILNVPKVAGHCYTTSGAIQPLIFSIKWNVSGKRQQLGQAWR